MPNRDVETIRDLIYYQYAKIIARRAFGAADYFNKPFDKLMVTKREIAASATSLPPRNDISQ